MELAGAGALGGIAEHLGPLGEGGRHHGVEDGGGVRGGHLAVHAGANVDAHGANRSQSQRIIDSNGAARSGRSVPRPGLAQDLAGPLGNLGRVVVEVAEGHALVPLREGWVGDGGLLAKIHRPATPSIPRSWGTTSVWVR